MDKDKGQGVVFRLDGRLDGITVSTTRVDAAAGLAELDGHGADRLADMQERYADYIERVRGRAERLAR